MIKVIETNGKIISLDNITFEEIQDYVCGYVEVITFKNEVMCVNEEGLIRDLATNIVATVIYKEETGNTAKIVGDIVLIDRETWIKINSDSEDSINCGINCCEHCGAHEVKYVIDPYDHDIHGVERWTYLCAECEHEYAQDL